MKKNGGTASGSEALEFGVSKEKGRRDKHRRRGFFTFAAMSSIYGTASVLGIAPADAVPDDGFRGDDSLSDWEDDSWGNDFGADDFSYGGSDNSSNESTSDTEAPTGPSSEPSSELSTNSFGGGSSIFSSNDSDDDGSTGGFGGSATEPSGAGLDFSTSSWTNDSNSLGDFSDIETSGAEPSSAEPSDAEPSDAEPDVGNSDQGSTGGETSTANSDDDERDLSRSATTVSSDGWDDSYWNDDPWAEEADDTNNPPVDESEDNNADALQPSNTESVGGSGSAEGVGGVGGSESVEGVGGTGGSESVGSAESVGGSESDGGSVDQGQGPQPGIYRGPNYTTVLGTTGDDVLEVKKGLFSRSYRVELNDQSFPLEEGDLDRLIVAGNGGNDQIVGSDLPETLVGGVDDDTIHGQGNKDIVFGGPGNDLIYGGEGDDELHGQDGNDAIKGDDGDDKIEGGPGQDTIFPGAGDDEVNAGAGDDLVDETHKFSSWNPFGHGDTNGDDVINGDAGDDVLRSGGGNDTVAGGDGLDQIDGGRGDDILDGNGDNDAIYGGYGADEISGGPGQNYLDGGPGDDDLYGYDDFDILSGGKGDDFLDGGFGDDTNLTGPGADVVVDTPGDADRTFAEPFDKVEMSADDQVQRVIVDPDLGSDGVKISGDQAFTDRVESDLTTLASFPTGQKLLADLDSSGYHVEVSEEADASLSSVGGQDGNYQDGFLQPGGNPGPGMDSNLYYSTTSEVAQLPDKSFISIVEFGHELVHGSHLANGTADPGVSEDTDLDGSPRQNPSDQTNIVVEDFELQTIGANYDQNGNQLDEQHISSSGLAVPPSPAKYLEPNTEPITENTLRHDLGIPAREGYAIITPRAVDDDDSSSQMDPADSLSEDEVVHRGPHMTTVLGTTGDDDLRILKDTQSGNYHVQLNGATYRLEQSDLARLVIAGNGGKDTIVGSDLSEMFAGGVDDDIVEAGGGDDIVFGGPGNDILNGGLGDDTIHGQAGLDAIDGGPGDDDLHGGSGRDDISGGEGDDTIRPGTGADTVRGDEGADFIDETRSQADPPGTGDSDRLEGGPGDDTIFPGSGPDLVFGGEGDDYIDETRGRVEASPMGDDDTISGGPGSDTIYPGAGNDTVYGGDGEDTIDETIQQVGSRQRRDSDILFGGDQDDTIYPGQGDDLVFGGNGDDLIDETRTGTVSPWLQDGDDQLIGEAGKDLLFAGAGDDKVHGGPGDDQADGGAGNDTIKGNRGSDVLYGGPGDDTLEGNKGNDYLDGGRGQDRLLGNQGRDVLSGGYGDDVLLGGVDDDTTITGPGNDTVLDTAGDGDNSYIGDNDNIGLSGLDRVTIVDPVTGLETEAILVAGDDKFEDRAKSDLTTLASFPEGQKILEGLRQSGHRVVLVEQTSPGKGSIVVRSGDPLQGYLQLDGTPGAGQGSTVHYATASPTREILNDEGLYPFVELSHELIHADHYAKGTADPGVSFETDLAGNLQRDVTGVPTVVRDHELQTTGLAFDYDGNLDGTRNLVPGELDRLAASPVDELETNAEPVTENSIRAALGIAPRQRYTKLGKSTGSTSPTSSTVGENITDFSDEPPEAPRPRESSGLLDWLGEILFGRPPSD